MWLSWNMTSFMAGYPSILKPWWPTSRPTCRKSLIPISYGPQGKQRRRTPWNYPEAPKPKQLITLPNPRWLVSSPCGSLKAPSQQLKHLLCTSCTWNRRVPRKTKNWKARTLMVLTGLQRPARAMKDTQMEEKHCYHCSSLEHFICDCLLVKASGVKLHLNSKEGTALKKGAWVPQTKVTMSKTPQEEAPMV